MKIKSICPYCGIGCKLTYVVEGNKIKKILPDEDDPISEGKPCIKGLTVHEVADKGRLKHPIIRKERREIKVSWKRALDYIYQNLKDLAPEEVSFFGSGKTTNEDNWAMLKFAKVVMQTNNTDSCCGRLCHAATVAGMLDCFGNPNLTKMEYVNDIDVLLIVGSDVCINYPVFFNKLMKRRNEIKIISVQYIMNQTSKFSDIALCIEPGTETVFLNALSNYIIKSKLYVPEAEGFTNFNELKKTVEGYTPELVERICNIPKDKFMEVAKIVAHSKCLGIFHGMGLTQHMNAIENVHSLLNVVILKNGKILSLRGEINVQGVGDIGFLPNLLPTGGFETLPKLEEAWKCRLPIGMGKNIVDSLIVDPVKAAFITFFNPAQSLPALNRVHKNLNNMFLVYCSAYRTLTADFADVILPIPLIFEKRGTITNGERLIRLVRPVRNPPGDAIPEWRIFKKLAKLFGKGKFFKWKNEKEIFKEIVKIVPAYRFVDPDKVYRGKDVFANKEIEYRRFMPERFEGKDEVRSREYPFLLITFRSRFQFLTGEMTEKSKTLTKLDEGPCVYVNPEDAKELGIKEGDNVKIVSEEGWIETNAKLSNDIPKGILAARFHYKSLLINKLFPARFDKRTDTPNYKCVSVRVEKCRGGDLNP